MKKVFLATLISLTFAGSAFAATPVINVDQGQLGFGYANYNLSTEGNLLGDLGSFKADGYQAAYGISDKLALTGDYLQSEKRSFSNAIYGEYDNLNYNSTSVGLQYKLNDNLAFSAGMVKAGYDATKTLGLVVTNDSNSSNEVFGGISYQQGFTSNLDGYVSFQKSAHIEDAKAGLKYGLGANSSLDVSYRSYKDTNSGISAKGVGVGMNYRF